MGAYAEQRKRLVKELKAKLVKAGAAGISVRGGRGTAWGWIDISGSGPGGEFTAKQRRVIEQITGITPGGNFWVAEMEEVERILGISYQG